MCSYISGYLLYYTKNRTFSPETNDVVFTRTEFVNLKNMDFSTTYYFRVKVQYKDRFGAFSRTVAFTSKSPGTLYIYPLICNASQFLLWFDLCACTQWTFITTRIMYPTEYVSPSFKQQVRILCLIKH